MKMSDRVTVLNHSPCMYSLENSLIFIIIVVHGVHFIDLVTLIPMRDAIS